MSGNSSSAKSWARAIEMTAPIAADPRRILSSVIEELAVRSESVPALIGPDCSRTYAELSSRSNQWARWAAAHDLVQGEVVALFMPNCVDYFACWLGITKMGGVVALLNTNLTGRALAHCVGVASPRCLIVSEELWSQFATAAPWIDQRCTVWRCRDPEIPACDGTSIELDVHRFSGLPLADGERPKVTIDDRALYIYTSGTTGLPKAATITHGRIMQWTHWFAGMMNISPADRMYNCLPMYHSVGGVLAPGAMLVGGGSVVVRRSFSASRFWTDIVEFECTLLQYVGELWRYLLLADPSPDESRHRIRMACGNGMVGELWTPVKTRFSIPRILEFYASTEGNVSLFNVEERPGAVGRVPTFLRHRFPSALVKFDIQTEQPVRDGFGRCVRCGAGEVGELISPIDGRDRTNIGTRYEGYTSRDATERKILRDVFQPSDAWFRTGDLMRMEDDGYFYFVDRIGDTFRWKSENVSSTEIAAAICDSPRVRQAVVYGIPVPGHDGRAGMATIVTDGPINLEQLCMRLEHRLPPYARPLFFRLRGGLDVTGTLKYVKSDLVRQGFDPAATSDPIYFNAPRSAGLLRVDNAVYRRICAGEFQL
jgi:fatty-acyl-CoA synthase